VKVGRTLYTHRVADWRAWLRKHHRTRREVWLVYYNKASGKPRISYNDAVEEALCFGWIDSQAAKVDADRFAQRFTPRRPGSAVSEMNHARVRRLVRTKRMTKAGLEAIGSSRAGRLAIPPDIEAALKGEPAAWRHFQRFPAAYRRMRVAFVDGAHRRPDEFRRRRRNLARKSAKNERFGMILE
jgi:uncharacterized protein YdeI (YjbR/CyaY-like superfamily)